MPTKPTVISPDLKVGGDFPKPYSTREEYKKRNSRDEAWDKVPGRSFTGMKLFPGWRLRLTQILSRLSFKGKLQEDLAKSVTKVFGLATGNTDATADDVELEDETLLSDRQQIINCLAEFKTTEMIKLRIDDWKTLQQKFWKTATCIQLMKTIPPSEKLLRHNHARILRYLLLSYGAP